jgi:hypothetical protein
MLFNPTQEKIEKTIRLPLYYMGLSKNAMIREKDGVPKGYSLNRDYEVELKITLHPNSYSWWVIE